MSRCNASHQIFDTVVHVLIVLRNVLHIHAQNLLVLEKFSQHIFHRKVGQVVPADGVL